MKLQLLLLGLVSTIVFACSSSSNKEKNSFIKNPSPAAETRTENEKIARQILDTVVDNCQYTLKIIAGEKDQLLIEKIKNGQSKQLTIEAYKDRLYLSTILFDQGTETYYAPLAIFSDELFAVGIFDQQLQKIWFIRDLPEGLKLENFDANNKPIKNIGRYLIYVPKDEILALPSLPQTNGRYERSIVTRYRISENMILRLQADTVIQEIR